MQERKIHALSGEKPGHISRSLWDHPTVRMPAEEALVRLNNSARLTSTGNPDLSSAVHRGLPSPDEGPFSIRSIFAGRAVVGRTPEQVDHFMRQRGTEAVKV